MALVTVTGYPCSGKSTRVEQLRLYLQSRISDPDYRGPIQNIVVISDDSLNLSRTVYDNSKSEKVARATIFTTLQRLLDRNSIVIVDSLNYIKGYRYQMYCAARELSLRVATIFVAATPEICQKRYTSVSSQPEKETYSTATFHNLIMRYEEPSSMARWDSPLFTLSWTDDSDALPYEMIWKSVTAGDVKPPNPGTVGAPKIRTDALQILDEITLKIVQAITSEQTNSGVPGGSMTISIPFVAAPEALKLHLTLPGRHLTLPELQRHKRQFVNAHKKAMTLGSTEKGSVEFNEESVAKRFAEYLETQLK